MINEYGTVGEWELAEEIEKLAENLPQCHLVYIKSQITWTAKFFPEDRIIQDSELKGGNRYTKTILSHNLFRDAILFSYYLPREWNPIIFRKMYKYLYFIIIMNSKESEDISLQIKHQNI